MRTVALLPYSLTNALCSSTHKRTNSDPVRILTFEVAASPSAAVRMATMIVTTTKRRTAAPMLTGTTQRGTLGSPSDTASGVLVAVGNGGGRAGACVLAAVVATAGPGTRTGLP